MKKIPEDWIRIKTIESHAAGEPLRVIVEGYPEIKGKTILEKRRYVKENLDNFRKILMFEPRGHADMYGALLVEPEREDSDIGVIFMHNEGYSTMCGHGIIAMTKVLLDMGIIEKNGDSVELKIDTPAGLVISRTERKNGRVDKISFVNVPSFVYLKDGKTEVEGLGSVEYDIAFGGAFYAFVDANKLGLELNPEEYNKIIEFGKKIKNKIASEVKIEHPFSEDLGFLYGTIFVGKAKNPENHSRNVCVFAEGEVDRSPTGTGVSARASIHYFKGDIKLGEELKIESIIGTVFSVKPLREVKFGDFKAIIPEVSAKAYITGESEFFLDPDDPLKEGFIFR